MIDNLDESSFEETKTQTDTDAVDNQVDVEDTEDQTIDGSEDETSEGTEVEEGKVQKGVEKRFAKITKEKYELRRELDELRNQVATMNKKPEPEYTRSDFGDDEDAYLNYKVDQKLKAQAVQQQQAYQAQEAARANEVRSGAEWKSKVDSFVTELPDYAEAVSNSLVELDDEEIDMIKSSDVGPKIAYAFATDDDLANKFNAIRSPRARDRFLSKLEMKLETQESKPARSVSKAPAPTPKASKSSKGGNFDPSKLSMDDWVKWRNGEL